MLRVQLFRIAGDFCHLASKFILMTSIHRNRSAEGMGTLISCLCARHTNSWGHRADQRQ